MKLSNVLASIKGDEKTASVVQAPKGGEKTAAATSDVLKAALRDVTNPPAEKIAAAAPTGSPVTDLIKTAGQMADAEHDAFVKEAQLYGASVADGFMARLSQYNEAAEKLGGQQITKVAAAQGDDSFEKFASENPALVKQAAEIGYANTERQIEKLAEAAHVAGYNKAVESIYKVGHACFSNGFEDTIRLIEGARQ